MTETPRTRPLDEKASRAKVKASARAEKNAARLAQLGGPPAGDDLFGGDRKPIEELPRNDVGNGQRLRRRHGDDVRFVDQAGWFVWTGQCWERSGTSKDPGHEIVKKAHATADAIIEEARAFAERAEHEINPARQEALLDRAENHHKFAIASGNHNKLRGMLSEAAPYLGIKPTALDDRPWLFSIADGTVELGLEVEKRDHAREDLLTHLSPVIWDAAAKCPKWDKFMLEAQPIEAVRRFIQRWAGYCLTGLTREQKVVLFYGLGANGKSVFLKVLQHVLGNYTLTVGIETFLYAERRADAASPDLARLPGARLLVASEPEHGARLSESVIKTATGGEKILARHLFEGLFEFTPCFKLILSANVKPIVRGQDNGIWRRLLLVLWGVTFDGEHGPAPNPHLADELIGEETAGIFNWLLAGLADYLENGLSVPDEVKATTEEYRSESDTVREFMTSCTAAAPGERINATRLFQVYCAWAAETSNKPISQTSFGLKLRDMGVKGEIVGKKFYLDIKLTWEPAAKSDDIPPATSEGEYGHG